jgi:hypothetical protein
VSSKLSELVARRKHAPLHFKTHTSALRYFLLFPSRCHLLDDVHKTIHNNNGLIFILGMISPAIWWSSNPFYERHVHEDVCPYYLTFFLSLSTVKSFPLDEIVSTVISCCCGFSRFCFLQKGGFLSTHNSRTASSPWHRHHDHRLSRSQKI